LSYLASGHDDYSVGIVGLGVGALAAVLGSDDELTFYEIDPHVVGVASDPRLFTYLQDSPARIEIVTGDGRLSLDRQNARHDLLIIDAFSGDAIPVHLLTREAFELYSGVVGGGLVMIHVSNRHLDLAPVVAATAEAAGMASWIWEYYPSPEAQTTGAAPSRWMLLGAPGTEVPPGNWWSLKSDRPAWTDDYSDIVSTISDQ
jgi:spermidine synthase